MHTKEMHIKEIETMLAVLYKEYTAKMMEYAESRERDDIFEVKRKIIAKMREIEKEIKTLEAGIANEK